MPLEFRIRFRITRRLTQLGKLASITARCEYKSVVVTRQLLANRLKESVGLERGETPLAARVTAFHLVQLAAHTRHDDELRLVDAGVFDADGFGLTAEHPYELGKRPPPLVEVAELVRRSAWEGHWPGSDIGRV